MALLTEARWEDFFRSASITDEAASTYAKAFLDNGFSKLSLPLLDKDTLKDVGITTIGHQLSIIQHVKSLSPPTSARTNTVAKASVSAKLSTITHEMTKPQFRKFQQDWTVYKQITHLHADDTTPHLYNACDDTVQTALTNTYSNFLSFDEKKALEVIESIVTIRVNPAVHRKAFGGLTQGSTTSVKSFVVQLRSSAVDCAFMCPSCHYDLSDIRIKDQLVQGLHNTNLQTEILAKASQLVKLDQVIDYAEAHESALRDQSTLANNGDANSDNVYGIRSTNNNRNRNRNRNNQRNTPALPQAQAAPTPCTGCGGTAHGPDRASQCPAWGQTCLYCGRANHLATACRRNPQRQQQQQQQRGVNSISQLSLVPGYSVTHYENNNIEYLMIVKHDPSTDTYTAVNTNIEVIQCTIIVGHPSCRKAPVTTDIFPDSGASICLAGPQHILMLKGEEKCFLID